jgi:hypothetical protein
VAVRRRKLTHVQRRTWYFAKFIVGSGGACYIDPSGCTCIFVT